MLAVFVQMIHKIQTVVTIQHVPLDCWKDFLCSGPPKNSQNSKTGKNPSIFFSASATESVADGPSPTKRLAFFFSRRQVVRRGETKASAKRVRRHRGPSTLAIRCFTCCPGMPCLGPPSRWFHENLFGKWQKMVLGIFSSFFVSPDQVVFHSKNSCHPVVIFRFPSDCLLFW